MLALRIARILLLALVTCLGMSLPTASFAFGATHFIDFTHITPLAANSVDANASALPGNQCTQQKTTLVEYELTLTDEHYGWLQSAIAAAEGGSPMSVQLSWDIVWTVKHHARLREAVTVSHDNLIVYSTTTEKFSMLPTQTEIDHSHIYPLTLANVRTLNVDSVLTVVMDVTVFAKTSLCGEPVEGATSQWHLDLPKPELVISY